MTVTNHRLDAARYDPTVHIRGVIEPKLIVIHGSGTRITKGSAVNYCKKNRRSVSYHIIVERDGTIVQLAPFNRRVNHAGRSSWKGRQWCNSYSIAVAFVDPGELRGTTKRAMSFYRRWFDSSDGLVAKDTQAHGRGHIWLPYTPEQFAAMDLVVSELRKAYPKIDTAAHFEVSPGRKIDPTPLVDISKVGLLGLENVGESVDEVINENHEMVHQVDASISVPDTGVVLAAQSREYKTTTVIKGVAGGGAAGLSVMEAFNAASLQGTKAYLDLVNGFVTSYGIPMLIGAGIGTWALCELVQYWKRQSYDDGNYEPSGAPDEAAT